MTYSLQQKTLSNAPTNVCVSDYILQTNLSQLTITDHFLNVLCIKTYPGIILQASQISIDDKYIVIVLIETCRIEICELVYRNCQYYLIPKSLKYYEKFTKPLELNPITTDVDSIALYSTSSFFTNYKNHVFVKISDNIISYFDIAQKTESWLINTKNDLNINFYVAFDYLTYFTIPTLAILAQKSIYIFSFDNCSAIKIDEIHIKDNAYDIKGMQEGFCYLRIKEEKTFTYELVIIPSTNMTKSISIDFEKVNSIKVYKNDIYLFCFDGLYRVEIIFTLGSINKYNVTKIWEQCCDFGDVNENFMFVGSKENDCYLIQYEKEKDISQQVIENDSNTLKHNNKNDEKMQDESICCHSKQITNDAADNNNEITESKYSYVKQETIKHAYNTSQTDAQNRDNCSVLVNLEDTQQKSNKQCGNNAEIHIDQDVEIQNQVETAMNIQENNMDLLDYKNDTDSIINTNVITNDKNQSSNVTYEQYNEHSTNDNADQIRLMDRNEQVQNIANYDSIYQTSEKNQIVKEDNTRVCNLYGLDNYKDLDTEDKQNGVLKDDIYDSNIYDKYLQKSDNNIAEGYASNINQKDDIMSRTKSMQNSQFNDIYNEIKINTTTVKKIKTYEIKNYSINAIKKINDIHFAVGNNKILKIHDFATIIMHESIKIKGFSRFYSQNNIICLTNERETFFINFDDEVALNYNKKAKQDGKITTNTSNTNENNTNVTNYTNTVNTNNNLSVFDTENTTIHFFTYKNKYVQATKKCIILENGKICFETEIVRVLPSKNYMYVLTADKSLQVYDQTLKITQLHNVNLFYVLDQYVYILRNSEVIIYDELHINEESKHNADQHINNHNKVTKFILHNDNTNNSYVDFVVLQTDNIYFILQTQKNFHYYSVIKNKIFYIKSSKIAAENVFLTVLNDKIFIFPDTFVFIAKNNVYEHKIQKKIIFISDNYILNKSSIAKYTINKETDYNNTFCIEEIKNNEKNHFIDFDVENQIFVIGSEVEANTEDDKKANKIEEHNEENIDYENDEVNLINRSFFKISLYSQDFVVLDHFDLKCNEYLIDLKFVKLNTNLKTEIISSDYYFTFLVATTSHLKGTKNLTKGRIIVFDIKNVQSQNIDVKNKKLLALADLLLNINVTRFTTIRGNIAVCQGTRIMIYKFDRLNGLTAIAFHDMHILTTSISCIKNYIIASDILKGVTFFYFQHKPVKIHKLSVSNEIKVCHMNKFFVFDNDLLLAAFDKRNLYLYSYKPWESASLKGTFLVSVGEGDLEEAIFGCGNDYFYSQKNIYTIRKEQKEEGKGLRTNKRLKMKNINEIHLFK